MKTQILPILLVTLTSLSCASTKPNDPHQWLEEIQGERPLNWVRTQNSRTLSELEKLPYYGTFESEIRKIVLATDRIPTVTYRAGWLYNFWQDPQHVRGIWRRTTLTEYPKTNPKWELLLDIDQLATQEKDNWVYHGVGCLAPKFERCLLNLSRGGKDASVIREFDISTKSFTPNGFVVPEGKHGADWLNADTLIIGADLGGDSLTTSGYPRLLRIWKRGTPLKDAPIIFEGTTTDMSVSSTILENPKDRVVLLERRISFFEAEYWVYDEKTNTKTRFNIPKDAHIETLFHNNLFIRLDSDWKTTNTTLPTLSKGALVEVNFAQPETPTANLVMSASERFSIEYASSQGSRLFVKALDHVKGQIFELTQNPKDPRNWIAKKLPFPTAGAPELTSSDAFSDVLLFDYQDFLTPMSVFSAANNKADLRLKKIKTLPPRFDASPLEVEQFESTSKDGTKIPYFLLHKKGLKHDGTHPTILYGYGGFQISETPYYSGARGKVWLSNGGVFALANIRGGGEFGPAWHQAALKKNRQKAYDDFISVAEHLIQTKVTSPEKLGIMGGSNGGLLVGAVTMQRPELFKGVVCQVPLLDMLRFPYLLAGASWMGEYGNPDDATDPAMREAILKYSPYQNLKKDGHYPHVFFVTSTGDDRVHPGHARKMAAKMLEYGHPFYYFENIEGGHGAAANLEQLIKRTSLEYSYFAKMLDLRTAAAK